MRDLIQQQGAYLMRCMAFEVTRTNETPSWILSPKGLEAAFQPSHVLYRTLLLPSNAVVAMHLLPNQIWKVWKLHYHIWFQIESMNLQCFEIWIFISFSFKKKLTTAILILKLRFSNWIAHKMTNFIFQIFILTFKNTKNTF